MRNDWFYSAFDPENDLTLEFVLHYLPKLTHCCEEDVIPLKLIHSSNFSAAINVSNEKSKLKGAARSALREKFVEETKSDVFVENGKEVFQKKYSVSEMCFRANSEANEEGLIVCATLLDRAPNLGGLCRTCEVFGVRKLVIGNASVLDDKDFVQLSVSSQKWVSIEEVKKNELSSYLTSMRRDHGYTLIAVEQTTGSKSMNQYQFPRKSLIILGNEKEGLPVEYLHQVNECVEIPQSGLIRSLNVHVTGAIIIWEYYKQMMERYDLY
ncbi:hypothetical protein B4U80_03549 [Leptotrombidium deliense]|uniref:tRNA (guanosine(18)-2'-O)-methyltransferase TARBP1 n=1 Tax=Leptotrombidium deliense TaxID=299467 RepID=A0A443SSW3_9ACAR|nr:hypothetical protein B4U80_03549 [Leptotrombidium deliense]